MFDGYNRFVRSLIQARLKGIKKNTNIEKKAGTFIAKKTPQNNWLKDKTSFRKKTPPKSDGNLKCSDQECNPFLDP